MRKALTMDSVLIIAYVIWGSLGDADLLPVMAINGIREKHVGLVEFYVLLSDVQ